MVDTPLLSVRDLHTTFPMRSPLLRRPVGHIRAVEGISFDLYSGETLGLVGESGSGKSTVARTIIGLESANAGQVLFDGADLTRVKGSEMRRIRRNVQMVFQDPHSSLNPRRTVFEIISEAWKIHPDVVPHAQWRAEAGALLERVGLNPDHADRYPHQFSGGQRQRIGVARALALKPKLIICDEAVSALDMSIQAQVLNLLEDLQRDLGLAYLFIAHDLSVVRHISDRVAVMYLGKLVELGLDGEIYGAPAHPYTQALLSAVPVPDPTLRGQRQEIVLKGDPPNPANPPSGCRFRTRCWKATEICAEEVPELIVRPGITQRAACHHASPNEDVSAFDS